MAEGGSLVKVLNQFEGKNFTLYNGDSTQVLKGLPSNSIGYLVTSPPFLSLYTYSSSFLDMGNSKNDRQFYRHFNFMVREIFRIMMEGRNVSIHCVDVPMMKERDGAIGLKDFPGMIIRIFQRAGFIYHSRVTIYKSPVVEMVRTNALGLLHKQLRKDSAMSRQGLPDYVLTFRKPGVNSKPITHTMESYPVGLWQKIAEPVWMDINQSNTLQRESAREEKDEKHIVPLQLDTIENCINLWSAKGDIVIDPFSGIGSCGYKALQLDRKYIGIELKESYFNLSVRNLEAVEKDKEVQQSSLFES